MKIRLVMKSVLENNYPGKTPEEIAKELIQTPAFSVIHHTMRDDLRHLAVTSIIQQMLSDGQITLTNDFDKKFETDKFDLGTNRKVAGLMGSTCYMADDFEKLYQKTEENILLMSSILKYSQFIGITVVLYFSLNLLASSLVYVEFGSAEFNKMINGLFNAFNSETTRSSALI